MIYLVFSLGGLLGIILVASLMLLQKEKMEKKHLEEALSQNEQNIESLTKSKTELILEVNELKLSNAQMQTLLLEEKKHFEEKISLLQKAEEKLSDAFKALSSEALEKSNKSFLTLAKETLSKYQETAKGDLEKKQQEITHIVKPVKETLEKLDSNMKALEKERKGEQESLKARMDSMIHSEKELRKETSTLAKALHTPHIRGRWGELQLKRVVELSGMVAQCDFVEQSMGTSDDNIHKPDMIINLAGDRQVIVDAKTPFEAYMKGMETDDESLRKNHLSQHAKHLRSHIQTLSKKAYWESFDKAPEFVVLFVPSENFYQAALEFDPTLIEFGADKGVILATPTTLIGLLRSIAHGWKQEKITKHAKEISKLGLELYKRLSTLGAHFNKMGRMLTSSVDSYNKAMGCYESRVLVSAKKFEEFGSVLEGSTMEVIEVVDKTPRLIAVDSETSI